MTLWDQLLELVRSTEKDRDIAPPPLEPELWRRTERTHHTLHDLHLELGDVKETLRLLTIQVETQAREIEQLKPKGQ